MKPLKKMMSIVAMLLLSVSTVIILMTPSAAASSSAVPQFSLKYVDNSYDVPPTTTSSTDPYTGQTTTNTIPGYHIVNKTVQAIVENNLGAEYYNFRYKGHYADEWSYYPFSGSSDGGYNIYDGFSVPCQAANSSNTVIPLYFLPQSIPAGGQVDVQAQALFGYYRAVPYGHATYVGGPTYDFYFNGTTSDWSSTQTITIGESAPNATATAPPMQPTPTPTLSPTDAQNPTPITQQPNTDSNAMFGLTFEQIAIAALVTLVVVLVVVVVFTRRGSTQ